jgi:hypothetical protein
MKRPVIHNQVLGSTTHRIFNGVMATALSFGIGTWVWNRYAITPYVGSSGKWLVYLCVPIGIAITFVNPKSHSLVEGLAGESGYDELKKD